LLQIGLAYAFGVLLSIVICAPTSGGHFNPCVTISFVVFKGFPPLKAIRSEELIHNKQAMLDVGP
jgi:glycerol uptake facilitator-like aquaporin